MMTCSAGHLPWPLTTPDCTSSLPLSLSLPPSLSLYPPLAASLHFLLLLSLLLSLPPSLYPSHSPCLPLSIPPSISLLSLSPSPCSHVNKYQKKKRRLIKIMSDLSLFLENDVPQRRAAF